MQQEGSSFSRFDVVDVGLGSTISHEHLWEVTSDLYFCRDPEETEKEEQAATEKSTSKEEFQGKWMARGPEFIATQPEVSDRSEGVRVPSVPVQQPPSKDQSAQTATEGQSAAPTAAATELVETTAE